MIFRKATIYILTTRISTLPRSTIRRPPGALYPTSCLQVLLITTKPALQAREFPPSKRHNHSALSECATVPHGHPLAPPGPADRKTHRCEESTLGRAGPIMATALQTMGQRVDQLFHIVALLGTRIETHSHVCRMKSTDLNDQVRILDTQVQDLGSHVESVFKICMQKPGPIRASRATPERRGRESERSPTF